MFGETAEVRAALPEGDKDIDTKESKGNSNKNSVKCKEEDGIVDGGKKSGVKRKQGKKNDRKIKDEEIPGKPLAAFLTAIAVLLETQHWSGMGIPLLTHQFHSSISSPSRTYHPELSLKEVYQNQRNLLQQSVRTSSA